MIPITAEGDWLAGRLTMEVWHQKGASGKEKGSAAHKSKAKAKAKLNTKAVGTANATLLGTVDLEVRDRETCGIPVLRTRARPPRREII